jgi:hypothetical protein
VHEILSANAEQQPSDKNSVKSYRFAIQDDGSTTLKIETTAYYFQTYGPITMEYCQAIPYNFLQTRLLEHDINYDNAFNV